MTEGSVGSSRFAIRLLLEMAVVFLGVYGAFVFDGVRESRARQAEAAELASALRVEIGESVVLARELIETSGQERATFEASIAAGERPELPILRGSSGYQTAAWDAAKTSGGASALDVDAMRLSAIFYSAFISLLETGVYRRDMYDQTVRPHLADHPDAYYYASTGDLRPAYSWVLETWDLSDIWRGRMIVFGDSALAALDRYR